MRKLRGAAFVAATIGSVSMLGAGVAAAQGGEEQPRSVTVNCYMDASRTENSTQLGGLVTVTGPLINLGDADSSATQQVCGIGNHHIRNTGGTSTGGTGTDVV